MDLTLNAHEQAILGRVAHALPHRSEPGALDRAHWTALHADGVVEALAQEDGLVLAAMALAEAARLGSLTPFGASALLLPLFQVSPLDRRPLAVADLVDPVAAPVRYGESAELLVRYEGAQARLYEVEAHAARTPPSQYVYPLGVPAPPVGAAIATAPAQAVLARHRLALAAEAVGAMDSALRRLCDYLTGRWQFGRPLASLQAVQHRLAELAVDLETARWMTWQAGWDGSAASAALAAAYAARRARRFAVEAHQLAGARGFTLAMGLGFDTLRLQALSVEAGGAKAHEAAAHALSRQGIAGERPTARSAATPSPATA
ncbi:MAG: acyl-CoA dehydrogenase domain protein [Phenylobacterium sp.]|nr:acyl-CoA dehydrogenase domain protein [Phenylobacterium sp.]